MLFRVLNVLMSLLFFFCVGLQYNVPDPLPWVAFYGTAGFLTAFAAAFPARYPWPLPALVGLCGLVWAATLAPDFLGFIEAFDVLLNFEMKDVLIGEARESLGLSLTAVWMAVLVVARLWGRRARARKTP